MPITALPTPPSTDDPTNFDSRADTFLAALPTFVTEANALEADLNNLVAAAYTTSSSTSLAIGTGSKSFNVQTGLGFIAGQSGVMSSAADPTNRMIFTVTSYNSTTGAMVVNVATIGGSGTHADWVVGLAPAGFQAGQTPGTTTNDSAAAGNVGEVMKNVKASGSAVSLTNNTAATIATITLTAGDWDVSAHGYFSIGSGVTASYAGAIINTAATYPAVPTLDVGFQFVPPGAIATWGGAVGVTQITVANGSTQDVNLIMQAGFSGGTASAHGNIRARRFR